MVISTMVKNRWIRWAGLLLPVFVLVACGFHTSSKTSAAYKQVGMASYYGHKFHGRRTASGERYNEKNLTAAHRSLPFGTRVRVTNVENGKNVTVRINDRGPFVKHRIIDLSFAAAKRIGMISKGVVKVEVTID